MKNRDIKAANSEDLKKKVVELRKELIKLRMEIATGTMLKNPGQVKKTKKLVAKILTDLNTRKKSKIKAKKTEQKEIKGEKNK